VLGLLAAQAWLTLGLFGPERTPGPVLDPQPLLSGRHPLHLYHGHLGARALLARGSLSCYDPAFHAGYPKTPVFDGGSRPAELALACAGGAYSPAAYKALLALLGCATPVLLLVAARGAGLSRAAACLAVALGLAVWWGEPCQGAYRDGEVDLLVATVLVVAQAGLLIRYHRAPGPLSLLGVAGAGLVGWFAHPLLLALLLPLFLLYYLSVGPRHRLAWHGALLGGLLTAVALNAFWLLDWVEYWWIRLPARGEAYLLPHRTPHAVWSAPLWGGPVDRGFACLLLLAAGVGALLYNQGGQRAAARLFGLSAAGFLALAVLGMTWEPAGRFKTARLLVPALLFAVVPAAHAAARVLDLARQWAAAGPLLVGGGAVATAVLAAPAPLSVWAERVLHPEPLRIGLDDEQRALVKALAAETDPSARVLWEDRHGVEGDSLWTALLPLLTDRAFVGGLDADAGIEHTAAGLCDGNLAGEPLRSWGDAGLLDYCERYNVGWVVAWSAASRTRFTAWPDAEPVLTLPGAERARLFRVRRRHSFALTGSARWLYADAQQIILGDVVPEKGEVVLSLHYQAGLRAAPRRVRVEPGLDKTDAIPFVRLIVEEPVARVTLFWDKR
jgi:hypothetical protein